MYIFIAIIFIAELIIAFNIIGLIIKADRKVCDLTECVKTFNPLAQTCMQYVRCLSIAFSENVAKVLKFIEKQHTKLIIKTISAVAIYGMLIMFKVRDVKMKRFYNLGSAIRDIVLELAI